MIRHRLAMVPPREQGQQRTATQGFASEEREDSQQGSQNSEEYNVAKVAEDMRRNVSLLNLRLLDVLG